MSEDGEKTMDVANKFFVGTQGGTVVLPGFQLAISPDDAILLAAWLVVMAEGCSPAYTFEEVYAEIVEA